jgi:hypothetical protein
MLKLKNTRHTSVTIKVMKPYLKGVIQPGNNRHYVGRKHGLIRYVLESLPLFVLLVYIGYLRGGVYWLLPVGYVVLAAIYYETIDKWLDKLSWVIFWRRIFPPAIKNADDIESERLMKNFAKSPTAENKRKLEEYFKAK